MSHSSFTRSQGRRRTLAVEALEARALLSAVPFASRPDLVAASDAGSSATDNKTNVTTPTFVGDARNAGTVKILVGSTEVGTAPVVDGRWSFTHPGLAAGTHRIAAQAVGEGGRLGTKTASLSIEIRTTAPAAPTLGIKTASGGTSTSGSVATNSSRPVFQGRGPSKGSVEVFVDGGAVGGKTVGSDRKFSVKPSAAITSGQHTVTAIATDLFGNRSAAATLALAVDADAPVAESIVRSSFDTVTVTFNEAVRGITPANFRFAGRTADGLQITSRSLTDSRLQAFVGRITGALSDDGRTYTLRAPNLDLEAGTFSIVLPSGGQVTDLAGNRLGRGGTLTVEVGGG
jgi:hypothetical protein